MLVELLIPIYFPYLLTICSRL